MKNVKYIKKINITFTTPNLNAGGAERVITVLANEFDRELFNVTLVVFGFKKDAKYSIDNIKTIFLNKPRVLQGVKKMHNYLRAHKPDVVLSVVEHLNTVMGYLSLFHKQTLFVGREVNVLSVLEGFYKPQSIIEKYIYRKRFQLLDAIICQSNDMKQDLIEHYQVPSSKLFKINNPISSDFKLKTSEKNPNILKCITVARLVKPKGHSRILEALSKINFPFHYTIIGNGPEKDTIIKQVNHLNIQKHITFVSHTNEVTQYLQQSDLYLQGSYVEGFPNAVIESCAVGTPVLAFKAPGGLNEIIKDAENGYIVDNDLAFVDKLENIQKNYHFSPRNVSKFATTMFEQGKIIKEYEGLIIQLFKSKTNKV